MNLKDIAELADVSISTVSKAFSGSLEISEETRERIFALAKEHDCFDRYNKNKFSKRVIAVIIPELKGDFYTYVVSVLYEKITAMGGVMIAASCDFCDERKAELFHYFASYCKADGIIVFSTCHTIKNRQRTPAVAIFNKKRHPTIDSIFTDMDKAVFDAVEHLKDLGHTEIGFAGEHLTLSKLKVFQSAMRKIGLPVRKQWIKTSALRFEEAGVQMVEEWIREDTLPTAIVAAYDNIAIGIIQALIQRGYRVPEDVSVIGMDDISVAPFLDPPLSSIETNTEETCRYAVELMMKKLENPFAGECNPVRFPAKFIPRGSTAPCSRRKSPPEIKS